ncbi:MAG: murein transglycosylase A [Gammaproteobacteria bacterium]|nr:murein transglycosylase A [Gammaproteobacteria bacterium]
MLILNLSTNKIFHRVSAAVILILSAIVVSCRSLPPAPGIGAEVSWSTLPGWLADSPAQAWPALQQSCQKMPARDARWKSICDDAAFFTNPDDETARAFFETRFVAREIIGRDNKTQGLITGYYEPLLRGSLTRSARYRYPVYGRPDNLVTVDLGELYPELKGKRLRGRLNGQRVVPYYSRAEIAKGKRPPDSAVLLWVDDPVELFFLEVQGSGRVQLADGRTLLLGYADQNGHPYVAIGRTLVEAGVFKLEEATMPAIRDWLLAHPEQAQTVLNSNPSYVFFNVRAPSAPDPIGALDVPLSPERSVAVDPSFIPLGSPLWLDTNLPDNETKPYQRLVFAQDSGGAIKGPARADLFLGFGAKAERLAGAMRQPGKLYVLQPRAREIN